MSISEEAKRLAVILDDDCTSLYEERGLDISDASDKIQHFLDDHTKALREERDALAAQNVAMRDAGEHLARSISSYVGLTGDSGIAVHGSSAISDWSKALSLMPTDAVERMRRKDDIIDRLIGFANHDDSCDMNKFTGEEIGSCSCGLSSLIEDARKEGVE